MKKRLADVIFSMMDGGVRWVERPVIVADQIWEHIDKSDVDYLLTISSTPLVPPFNGFLWEARIRNNTIGAAVGYTKPTDDPSSLNQYLLHAMYFSWDGTQLFDEGEQSIELDSDGYLKTWLPSGDNILAIGSVLLYTLAFLNYRNIELIEQRPSAALSRKHERKYGVPLTKYYELGIKGFSRRYPASGNKVERFMPHHIVRGHFKTYTPEKPRFGRPGDHGRFWVDSFAKGDKEAGEIKKRWKVIQDESPGA